MKDRKIGFYLAEPTGEVSEEDPYCIEVKMPDGQLRFAKPCFSFPFTFVPHEGWIKKYSKIIWVWLTYEQGLIEKPIYVGFSFKPGKEKEQEDFPFSGTILSEKFKIQINDKQETLKIEQLEGKKQKIVILKEKTYVESKDINMGAESGDEPAVLGDTLQSLMEELLDLMAAAKTMTQMGPQTFMPDTQQKIVSLKSKLKNFKSSTNKLTK
jgi:hypothetical protein